MLVSLLLVDTSEFAELAGVDVLKDGAKRVFELVLDVEVAIPLLPAAVVVAEVEECLVVEWLGGWLVEDFVGV